jgi:hypothetical protein
MPLDNLGCTFYCQHTLNVFWLEFYAEFFLKREDEEEEAVRVPIAKGFYVYTWQDLLYRNIEYLRENLLRAF